MDRVSSRTLPPKFTCILYHICNTSQTHIDTSQSSPCPTTTPILLLMVHLTIWVRLTGSLGIKIWTQWVLGAVSRAAYSYAYTL